MKTKRKEQKVTKADVARVMSLLGKSGGAARAKKLSKAKRVRIAAKGGRAKAAKAKARRAK